MKKIMVLFIGLSLVLGLWAYTKANGEEVTVCVGRNGLMHVIGEGFRRTECRRGETLLSWNTQGEKGDTGEQGEQGEKGDKGDDGEDGNEVHLFDAAGQDLGIFLFRNGSSGFTVFNQDLGLILRFPRALEFKPDGGEANFKELDCKGPVFMFMGGADFIQTVFRTMGEFRTPVAGEVPADMTTFSLFRESDSTCVNSPGGMTLTKGIEMETIPALPFTEPLALPLEIKSL